jgi:hypothetical protein
MTWWIKLHQSLANHPYWVSEPFTRGQAWVDLILLAHTSDGHVRVQGVKIDVSRGDVSRSEVTLAERWGWSRGKIRRFLDELESEQMITRERYRQQDRRKSIISIVNYSKFQDKNSLDSTGDDTSNGTSDSTGDGTSDGTGIKSSKIGKSKESTGRTKQTFSKPSLEEVTAYCQERANGVDPNRFINYYESNGWKVGKNQMKDWKAGVRNWERNDREVPKNNQKCQSCRISGFCPPTSVNRKNPNGCREYEEKK